MKKENLVIKKVFNLYKNEGWKSYFARIRFWDAPYIEVEKIIPQKGTITDIGCGEGIFTNFLALSSGRRNITGIELDKRRISQANHGVNNVKFIRGDATKVNIEKSDAIIIFHVLHHLLSYSDQEKVIDKSLKALKKNGKLVIVEVNKKLSFKYLITWITDHFLVPMLFEKRIYSPIFFRSKKEWIQLLKSKGLKVKVKEVEQNKPFTHIIIEASIS